MLIAFAFFTTRLIAYIYNLSKYWEIRQFYQDALKIESVSMLAWGDDTIMDYM